MLLESEGWDVVGEAADGTRALSAAVELRPDLVLLDIQLPDVDGFEVSKRLASSANGPVVILVSSRDCEDYGQLAFRSGARGFIAKAELSGDALKVLL